MSDKLARATRDLNLSNACKIALRFSSRFWQRAPFTPTIHGGRSVTGLSGNGFACSPPYRIGQEGPASLVYDEYISGVRQCWGLDPLHARFGLGRLPAKWNSSCSWSAGDQSESLTTIASLASKSSKSSSKEESSSLSSAGLASAGGLPPEPKYRLVVGLAAELATVLSARSL